MCVIDWSPTPWKEETTQLDGWKRCPQRKADRGRSLGTLRENYFLSLLLSWEAQETPASRLLYPLGDKCSYVETRMEGERWGPPSLPAPWGPRQWWPHAPHCPALSLTCSCAAQLSQSPRRVASITVWAWVSSAVCTSSFLPLLGLHHCMNGISKGIKYFQIMSAAPDITSQPTAAQCSWNTG